MTTALGITTYNRPDYFTRSAAAVAKLWPTLPVYVYEDGSDAEHHRAYRDTTSILPHHWAVTHAPENRGCAYAKNALLAAMLADGAEWLFLLEDDVVPQSTQAIDGYMSACLASGLEHLAFHAHGPANAGAPRWSSGPVTYWPNSVGAFSVYSRRSLLTAGLFDETFDCAWEHVEHSQRLAAAGFTTPWPDNADATGSETWLREIPGSIEHSSIWPRPDHHGAIERGREHWRKTYPHSYAAIFGHG